MIEDVFPNTWDTRRRAQKIKFEVSEKTMYRARKQVKPGHDHYSAMLHFGAARQSSDSLVIGRPERPYLDKQQNDCS